MIVLFTCLLIQHTEVIYEPDEFTDAIVVYNYSKPVKKCIEVIEPEKEKNQKTPAISYDELNDAFHSILNDYSVF